MKKFSVLIVLVLGFGLILGLVFRNTYIDHDIMDMNELDDFVVRGVYENTIEDTTVEDELNQESELSEGFDGFSSGEPMETYDVTFEDDNPYGENTIDYLSNSEYIFKVEGESQYKDFSGVLVQSVKVLSVIKGGKHDLGCDIEVVSLNEGIGNSNNTGEHSLFKEDIKEDISTMDTGCVNFMQKDKEYIVFLNPVIVNEKEVPGKYYLATKDMPYFCIEDIKNIPIEELGKEEVKYSEVKGFEFFAKDYKSLDAMLDLKMEVLKKYNN